MKKNLRNITAILITIITAILCVAILIIVITHSNSNAHLSSTNSYTYSELESVISDESTQDTSEPLVSFNSQLTPSSKLSTITSSSNQPSSSTTSQKQEITKPERVEKEESEPVAIVEKESMGADPNPIQTYEENKRKHEEAVKDYLEENNIDVNTAGETGETCVRCGKKLWNPDKYGFGNPGYPENFEDSGYCTGACGIILR